MLSPSCIALSWARRAYPIDFTSLQDQLQCAGRAAAHIQAVGLRRQLTFYRLPSAETQLLPFGTRSMQSMGPRRADAASV